MLSFRKKEAGWMAVNLLPDRVDLAHVNRAAGGRPQVMALHSFHKEGADAKALATLRRKYALGKFKCITALQGGEYQMLQLDAPNVPRGEMKEAVRWRIKDMIDYAPDAATIDVVEVASERAGAARARSLFVFSARNDVVRERMQLFESAKAPLEAIDVPEMALRNVADLWAQPGRAVALIGFDESGGILVIAAGGELVASRRIEVTAAQLADKSAESRRPHLERIGLELQRSFDHYDRQPGIAPLARLLVMAPVAPGLVEYLTGELTIPVEMPDLGSVLDIDSVPELRNQARQAQCLMAIGLALRESAP
jgi:MSHA biogenesis protein MshI